jgi:hypothetical protein
LLHSGLLHCFSYPADVPPGTSNRDVAQSAQSGYLHCFSYPADVPPGIGNRDAAQPAPPGLRRMPAGTCFRY